MRKITIILILLMVSTVWAGEFDFWENLYNLVVNPEYEINFSLTYEPCWRGPYNLELQLSHDLRYPIKVSRVEYDWRNVKPVSAILFRGETINIRYDPLKPALPGFHAFLVEAGNALDKKIIIAAQKIDPEVNVLTSTRLEEIKRLFGKLQEFRGKIKTLDGHFKLLVHTRKGEKRIEQKVEGKLEITGEDKYDFIFASIPEIKINGRPLKGNEIGNYNLKPKKGSRLLLWPRNLAYYIPYDDLFNYYNWYLYKRIEAKVWMAGNLLNRDLWLPQFMELVIDEKRGLPLEVKAFIYNKEFYAAEARIEYDKNGLPIKQILKRRLPGGENEESTLELSNLSLNQREPRKRWFLL